MCDNSKLSNVIVTKLVFQLTHCKIVYLIKNGRTNREEF